MNVELYVELLEEKFFAQEDKIKKLESRINVLEMCSAERQGATAMSPTVMRNQIHVEMDKFSRENQEQIGHLMNAVNRTGQKLSDAMP